MSDVVLTQRTANRLREIERRRRRDVAAWETLVASDVERPPRLPARCGSCNQMVYLDFTKQGTRWVNADGKPHFGLEDMAGGRAQ